MRNSETKFYFFNFKRKNKGNIILLTKNFSIHGTLTIKKFIKCYRYLFCFLFKIMAGPPLTQNICFLFDKFHLQKFRESSLKVVMKVQSATFRECSLNLMTG